MASSTAIALALLGIVLLLPGNAFVVVAYPRGGRGGDYRMQFLGQQNAAKAAMGFRALVWDQAVCPALVLCSQYVSYTQFIRVKAEGKERSIGDLGSSLFISFLPHAATVGACDIE
ncbi:hypothetical protein OsJ_08652 [Oryza sativa Japonica Group]|uniref:Uncharacterized protein n=1 Tax=Oryza sativa subsp. japonica TaxID=39947 RepID=A3AC32_ORYSJ|nr:hypothetical protein OsJ_08652 [Oryza sativa Japonica Group]